MTMKRDGSIGRLAFTALALSAFLLAAGIGSRLRPLTDATPMRSPQPPDDIWRVAE